MDLIVLDWTRMGRQFCLAGVVVQGGEYRVVRPLPAKARGSATPNVGWSPFLLHGCRRWEFFELVRPQPAEARAPHLEDVWVTDLRPRGLTAAPQQRRAILEATAAPEDKPLFGAALAPSYSGTYLDAGQGERSLVSLRVASRDVHFTALWREGAGEPDYRASLPVPGLDRRILPLKDHFLLARAEQHSQELDTRLGFLNDAVRRMGEEVVVRLGLSRPFPAAAGRPGRCWLMADGFFSLSNPQE